VQDKEHAYIEKSSNPEIKNRKSKYNLYKNLKGHISDLIEMVVFWENGNIFK
jgi:hypothetical protein